MPQSIRVRIVVVIQVSRAAYGIENLLPVRSSTTVRKSEPVLDEEADDEASDFVDIGGWGWWWWRRIGWRAICSFRCWRV